MTDQEPLVRPARPVMIEAAAAILLVGGALGIVETVIAGADRIGGTEGLPTDVLVGFALNALALAVGWLLRNGRAWVLCLNVTALFAFLYLSAFPDPLGIVFGAADLYVVGVLVYQRRWFDAVAAWRASLPIATRPVR